MGSGLPKEVYRQNKKSSKFVKIYKSCITYMPYFLGRSKGCASVFLQPMSVRRTRERPLANLQDVFIQADDVRIAEDQVKVFESF